MIHRFYSYDGDWHKGYMEGRGVYLFDDDLKYEGEFKASKPHGQGSTTYPGGQSYTGAWKNGSILVPFDICRRMMHGVNYE